MATQGRTPRIIIVGGGFGGLTTAKRLRHVDAEVTLIDRRNFHLFQPLLYQVATGGLSPANISVPLRAALKRQQNLTVLLGEVTTIDVTARTVSIGDMATLPFDYLVLATGSEHHYFGNPEWEQHAPGLKTIEDATEMRRKILSLFEQAELESDPTRRTKLLRFVIVGGGPTGVELAGAVAEIAHHTLLGNFRNFDPADAQILLLEAADQILNGYRTDLVEKAKRALFRLGVTVHENTLVKSVAADHLLVAQRGRTERIDTVCVLWAAGVRASPLGKIIAEQTGISPDKAGRLPVSPDLSLPGYPNVFVIGDLAALQQNGHPIPGVAPAAMQEGRYVATALRRRIGGHVTPLDSFRYRDKGMMATIGRSFGIVQLKRFAFAGFIAWLLWLWVHIIYLAQFTNRVLVVIQWGWSYFTFNRSARIITETGRSGK